MTPPEFAETREACPIHPDAAPIGVEVRGVYDDGVLYWICGDCRTRFHRWPEGHRLREATWAHWDRLDIDGTVRP